MKYFCENCGKSDWNMVQHGAVTLCKDCHWNDFKRMNDKVLKSLYGRNYNKDENV